MNPNLLSHFSGKLLGSPGLQGQQAVLVVPTNRKKTHHENEWHQLSCHVILTHPQILTSLVLSVNSFANFKISFGNWAGRERFQKVSFQNSLFENSLFFSSLWWSISMFIIITICYCFLPPQYWQHFFSISTSSVPTQAYGYLMARWQLF